MNSKIKIFITSDTFDKEYNEITSELFFSKTHMSELLVLGRCKSPIEIEPMMMVDNLDMTEERAYHTIM